MFKHCLAGILLCGSAAFATVTAAAAEIAIVTDVRGNAQLAGRQLGLLDGVRAGDRIELAAGAVLVVFRTAQAQQFTLAGPGRFLVGADGVSLESGAGSVRLDQRDPVFSRIARQRGQVIAGAIVRSGSGEDDIELVAPFRPAFGWPARPHRGHWRFRLVDDTGLVIFETTLAQTGLTLPATVHLEPSRHYQREVRWQAQDGTVQVGSVPVQALATGDDAQLARLAPPAGAPAATRVLFALYLRSLGVLTLARQFAPEIDNLDVTP